MGKRGGGVSCAVVIIHFSGVRRANKQVWGETETAGRTSILHRHSNLSTENPAAGQNCECPGMQFSQERESGQQRGEENSWPK